MTRDERNHLSALLARLADGDREAFAPMFARLWPLLRSFAGRVANGTFAAVIALLTGALGCFFVGIGGLGGMVLGLPLGGAVGWIRGTNEA